MATLQDFQAGYVAQRTAGKTVRDRLPVCYSGSAPSDPRVAVLRADGSVLLDYASAPVASSGVLAGPSVPQGDGYRVALKDGASGTPQTGGNAWGVGVNILFHGQSNEGGMLYGDGGGGALPSDVEPRARWFDADGWRALSAAFLTPTTHVIARETVRALGGAVPVGLTRLTQDGSSISQHLPGGDVYPRLFLASGTGAAVGGGNAGFASPRWVWSGDFEAAHYYQGEGDAGNTEAYFYARLGDLEAAYVAAGSTLGRTPETLFLTLTLIAGMWGATNVQGVRRAIQRRVAEWRAAGRPREVMGGLDLYSDGLHLTYPQHRILGRRTAAVLRRIGTGDALSGRYGAASSMARSGLQVRVKFDLAGATGLQARKGGAPSGFAVSGDAFAADKQLPAGVSITAADEVTVTLPGSFAGRAATVAYQEAIPNNGDRIAPTPSDWPDPNIPFDGSSYPDISNPLELVGKPIPASAPDYAGDTGPTATPVLPTFVTVTLSDGQTWTAPAGATSAGAAGGTTGGGTTGTGTTTTTPATTASGRVPYVLLHKAGGLPILFSAGGAPLLSGPIPAGGVGNGSTGTPAPGKVTGVAITSITGTTAGYTWNAYTAAAVTEYSAELRPRGGAAGTGDTWTGIGRWAGPPGSKGGLTDASAYELRIVAYNGTAVVAVSDPVAFTVGTVSTGAGTGAGTGTSTGGDTTTPAGPTATYSGTIEALRLTAAVPTLPVPLRVKAEEAYTRPPVCCGFAFGPGDVPSGSRVRLRTAAGAEIPVQQDDETRWPDGSLKYCVGSFVSPDTFAAGQTISYTVDAVAGAPDRTASYTLSQLAANSDFRLEVKGHSFGSAVGQMRVNDVIASGKIGSWGLNPKLGAEVVASGPIRQEWLFWGVARRASDGAYHESVRLELYVRRWAATGAYQLIARQRQPNLDAAYSGSTWSTSGWNRGNAGIMECFNGTARVFAMGGPNDRDARTVAPDAWDTGDGGCRLPVGQNLGQASGIGSGDEGQWYGHGVSVGVSGNLPGGISGADVLFGVGFDGGTRKMYFTRSRNNWDGRITLTSRPGGDTIVYPLVHSWPGAGCVAADVQGDPFWSGTGAAPRVRVGHDAAYLTRTSRLFAPMDLTQPRPDEPPGFDGGEWDYHPHRPGQVVDQWNWDWGNGGDNWDRDRIGWLSRQHANWLLTPFDKRRRTHCLALAYSQADKHWDWCDQRSGRVPCVNNGPDGAGASYPEMSPPQPTLYLNHREGLGLYSATPGFAAMAYSNTGGSGYDASLDRYGPINEASHYPSWQIVPYLMTGHRVFLDIMRTNTASIWASKDDWVRNRPLDPPFVPVRRVFHGLFFDQPRSNGWMKLALSNLRHVLPASHPERPYLDDVARDNAEYWGAIAPYSPHQVYGHVQAAPYSGKQSEYTLANYWDEGYWHTNTGFHAIYEAMGALMCIWRGETAYLPVMDVYLKFLRDRADDQQSPNGTGFFTGIYGSNFTNGDNSPNRIFYQAQEWIERQSAILDDTHPGVSPPFPNNRNWSGDNRRGSYDRYLTTKYDVQQCAVLGFAAWIAKPDGTPRFPGCDRVRLQLINRLAGTPGATTLTRYSFADPGQPGQVNLQWSLLPPNL